MKEWIVNFFKDDPKRMPFSFIFPYAYLFFIIMYTVDDVKGGFTGKYPVALIIIGFILHSLAVIILKEKNGISFKGGNLHHPSYIPKQHKTTIFKMVPVGLTLLYSYGLYFSSSNGGTLMGILMSFLLFLPALGFLFVLGYFKKKYLTLFRLRIAAINHAYFFSLIIILLLMQVRKT